MNTILLGLGITLLTICFYFFISGVVSRYLSHHHKWQVRGRNRYGGETYRICLKCRKAYKRVNKISEDERWEECEPIPELDNQFDQNDNYIWSS